MIVGHGIDVVDVSGIRNLLAFAEEDFLLGTFTALERGLWYPAAERAEYFAGRLAGKEAVAKALGTGLGQEVCWQHIEIGREAGGGPIVLLNGPATARSDQLKIQSWFISISHSPTTAMASVIAQN